MTHVTADAAKVLSIGATARMLQDLALGRATDSALEFDDYAKDARALFEIALANGRAGAVLRANPHADAARLHLPHTALRIFETLLVDWISALDTCESTASVDGVLAIFDSSSNTYGLQDRNTETYAHVERSVLTDLRRVLWEATGRVIEPTTVEASE